MRIPHLLLLAVSLLGAAPVVLAEESNLFPQGEGISFSHEPEAWIAFHVPRVDGHQAIVIK